MWPLMAYSGWWMAYSGWCQRRSAGIWEKKAQTRGGFIGALAVRLQSAPQHGSAEQHGE